MYLKSGKLETRIYQGRMKSYTERLTVVEEKLADAEAREVLKRSLFKMKGKK